MRDECCGPKGDGGGGFTAVCRYGGVVVKSAVSDSKNRLELGY